MVAGKDPPVLLFPRDREDACQLCLWVVELRAEAARVWGGERLPLSAAAKQSIEWGAYRPSRCNRRPVRPQGTTGSFWRRPFAGRLRVWVASQVQEEPGRSDQVEDVEAFSRLALLPSSTGDETVTGNSPASAASAAAGAGDGLRLRVLRCGRSRLPAPA